MFFLLHNFIPQPVLLNLGFITIYWYGLFIVLAIIFALLISLFLAKQFKIDTEIIWDLSFYLVLFGIIGARIYEIFLELPYYLNHPLQIIKIWQGGLAIHGAIIMGALTLLIFIRKKNLNFWKLSAVFVPGLALGQAIGRFGNWFNQELFGLPTNLPWGIPINPENRPLEFITNNFFHPTFFYESLGSLVIFLTLLLILWQHKNNLNQKIAMRVSAIYLGLYSILRFSLEFIKIDLTPVIAGLRWPQIFSLLLLVVAILIFKKSSHV